MFEKKACVRIFAARKPFLFKGNLRKNIFHNYFSNNLEV